MMLRALFITAALLFSPFTAQAAGEATPVPNQQWSFEGVRGDWDLEQILRGYQVATQVCLACHSFKYISHRNMMKLGFSEEQVTKLADEMGMGIDDKLKSALTPADAQEVYGKAVPDLSLMTKARPNGIDYTYALLTGYSNPPADFEVPVGGYYNEYFPGHVIAMPAPLTEGMVTYADGSSPSVQQAARDVSAFMAWTAEPERIERQRLGVFVLIYLVIFTILMYIMMKKTWADVKDPNRVNERAEERANEKAKAAAKPKTRKKATKKPVSKRVNQKKNASKKPSVPGDQVKIKNK